MERLGWTQAGSPQIILGGRLCRQPPWLPAFNSQGHIGRLELGTYFSKTLGLRSPLLNAAGIALDLWAKNSLLFSSALSFTFTQEHRYPFTSFVGSSTLFASAMTSSGSNSRPVSALLMSMTGWMLPSNVPGRLVRPMHLP